MGYIIIPHFFVYKNEFFNFLTIFICNLINELKTENMKTLISNSSASYCSETVMHTFDGKDTRFKIVVENGNCYFRVKILIQTLNGDFALVATEDDIPNLNHISYVSDKERRLAEGLENIVKCKSYIKSVF